MSGLVVEQYSLLILLLIETKQKTEKEGCTVRFFFEAAGNYLQNYACLVKCVLFDSQLNVKASLTLDCITSLVFPVKGCSGLVNKHSRFKLETVHAGCCLHAESDRYFGIMIN